VALSLDVRFVLICCWYVSDGIKYWFSAADLAGFASFRAHYNIVLLTYLYAVNGFIVISKF